MLSDDSAQPPHAAFEPTLTGWGSGQTLRRPGPSFRRPDRSRPHRSGRPSAIAGSARQRFGSAEPARSDPSARTAGAKLPWLLLAGCLALALPGLLIDLHTAPAIAPAEQATIARSVHTYNRWARGEDPTASLAERLVPYVNGQPQYETPPGGTWAHLSGYLLWGLAPERSVSSCVLHARLVSVLAALLALAAIFWAAHSLSGQSVSAALASLTLAANPLFLHFGRLGTETIHLVAWSSFTVAAALWALRPLRPPPSLGRQFCGWLLCGLGMGLCLVLTGWIGLAWVFLPLIVMMMLCPQRLSHLLGLVAATALALLLAMPWAVFAHVNDPQAWTLNLGALAGVDGGGGVGPSWQGLAAGDAAAWPWWGGLVLAVLPWPLWLIGSTLQPFSTASRGHRLRFSLGWAWWLTTLALMGLTGSTQPQHAILLAAPSCLLVAELFRQFTDLAAEARVPRLWWLLRWPHLAAMAAVSLGLTLWPWLAPDQPPAWLSGLLGTAPEGYAGTAAWLSLGVTLLTITGLSLRWSLKEYPARTLLGWSLWGVLLSASLGIGMARRANTPPPMLREAQEVGRMTQGTVFWVRCSALDPAQPPPALLLYANRTFAPVPRDRLHELASERGAFHLLMPRGSKPGLPDCRSLKDFPNLERQLWRFDPTAPRLRPLALAEPHRPPGPPDENRPMQAHGAAP